MGFSGSHNGPFTLRVDHVYRMLFPLRALRIRSALRFPKPCLAQSFLNLFSARGMMDLGKAISKPFLKRLSVKKLKIAKSACDNP